MLALLLIHTVERMKPVMDAVRPWRYRPYLLNGRPVEVETAIGLGINMGQ